jgi:biotin carboxylase
MKKRMCENNIPTAKYCIINNLNDVEEVNIKYPLIAKPIAENGSIEVKRINCFDELNNYLNDNANGVTNGGIIIEEHYKGIEIQADCFIKNKIAHVLMIRQKEKISKDGYGLLLLGSFSPAQISHKAEKEIYDISQKIVQAFELDNTPMHFQAFVDGDTVNVIEIAARIPGTISYKSIKMATGFDILDYSVDILLGKEGSLHYNKQRYIYSIVLVYAKASVLGKVTGLKELVDKKIIEDYITAKTEGMVIPFGISAQNRVAFLLFSAESTKEMAEKIDYAFQQIDILDIDGKPVMIRELKKTVI